MSWRESDHPRVPAGTGHGGEFRSTEPGGWVQQAVDRLTAWRPMTRGQLHALVQAGAEPVGQVHGGEMAYTQLMAHPGGAATIHKTYPAVFGDRPSHEVAVGLVAEAIGAPYPAVVPDPQDDHAIFMQYVDSHTSDIGLPTRGDYNRDLRTDDALLLGFLDILTLNGDRNGGNYIHTPDGRVVGIDGGEAFLSRHREDDDGTVRPPTLRVPGFSVRFTKLSPWLGRIEWRDNDLSPADFEAARPRLQDLRRHFQQLGLGQAHADMMARFDAMAEYATGTERKLPI